tara:strand:+ start:2168 stop:2641 length:474 start_codon:yes stop_codon:yes gene_type:complete
MIDWAIFTIVSLLVIEVGVILYLYKHVLSKWNARATEKRMKADGGEYLLDILNPVIDTICERILGEAPIELTKVLKGELLSAQGNLSRAVIGDSDAPEDMLLQLSTSMLQSLGYKRPSPLLAAKLASVIGNVAVKLEGPEEPVEIGRLPVGADLFKQ